MNLLTIENLSKSYTDKVLFDKISLGINDGDRVGVIGINGTGKSTLLRMIAGIEEPDEGTVTKNNGLRIAYLPQTPVFDDNISLLQNVVQGLKAEEAYRNIEGEARAMLAKLGLNDPDAVPSTLSGGQRKRAALVHTLLMPSDFLVLDEPTNHLDSEMTEWLEEYLSKYKGAYIMITHDRYFLDEVTNKIVELDKGKLYSYQTNYSGFIELKAEREEMVLATERKAKSLFRTELEWMMRGARARSTKQKAHIQRFNNLKNRARIEVDSSVEISSVASRMGKKTIELSHVSKSYDGKVLFRDFSYIFLSTDRIGIIGPNGCGKSTLIKVITGVVAPDEGMVDTGTTIKAGYFSQENEYMDTSLTVLEYIRETAEYIKTTEGTISASQMCEKFLFTGSMQYSKISKLSGGEKRRLYLLKVLMEAPNILILDEPTNDLDIQTLTILEDYLQSFNGIIITVSHDRYFLDKIATSIFAFDGQGNIKRFEGNYSEYAAVRELPKTIGSSNTSSGASAPGSDSAPKNNSWKQREQKLKFTYQEQRDFDTIDNIIAELEDRIAALENDIAAAATDYSKLNSLMEEKQKLEAELDAKMERWMYLNDLYKKIQNQ